MEPNQPKDEFDDEAIMDHVALECMHAIEAKDKESFRNSFHVLVAHIVSQMSEPEKDGQ